MTTQAIADQLGITRQGVEAILKRVESRELVRLSKSVERVKVTNHHRLEHVIEESFAAWHKSKEPLKRASRKKTGGVNINPDGDDDDCEQEVTSTEVIERTGDVRYLHTGMGAMEAEAKLWGLEVLPASNERASSISELAQDMKRRGEEYETRQNAEDTPDDSARTPDGRASGVAEVQGGPGPVQ
jgi:hypothetical protein